MCLFRMLHSMPMVGIIAVDLGAIVSHETMLEAFELFHVKQ